MYSNDEFGKNCHLIWINMVIVYNNSFVQSTEVTDRNPLLCLITIILQFAP